MHTQQTKKIVPVKKRTSLFKDIAITAVALGCVYAAFSSFKTTFQRNIRGFHDDEILFTPLDERREGAYSFFRYDGPFKTRRQISDAFDLWDEEQGNRCLNTAKRNVFYRDTAFFVKARCSARDVSFFDSFKKLVPHPDLLQQERYAPFSLEAKQLFHLAAQSVDLPLEWAKSDSLHAILARESDGFVGIPNYTIRTKNGRRARDYPDEWLDIHRELKRGKLVPGSRRARSSATGLGQLLLGNVEKYYPTGKEGIGDPLAEAAGMLLYIEDRYGSPDEAWKQYGKNHEGY